MTPKERAHKLHMKYYFMLPNNGSNTGLVSIPIRWKESIECAIVAVETIMDFMQMDDEYHEDCHFANSKWVSYWISVKEELNKKLEESKEQESKVPIPPKSQIIHESSWLETLTFGLYKDKRNENNR